MGHILKNRHFSTIWLPWQPEMAGNLMKIKEFVSVFQNDFAANRLEPERSLMAQMKGHYQ